MELPRIKVEMFYIGVIDGVLWCHSRAKNKTQLCRNFYNYIRYIQSYSGVCIGTYLDFLNIKKIISDLMYV